MATETDSAKVTSGPYHDPGRTSRAKWVVTTRRGAVVTSHAFHDQADAQDYRDRLDRETGENR